MAVRCSATRSDFKSRSSSTEWDPPPTDPARKRIDVRSPNEISPRTPFGGIEGNDHAETAVTADLVVMPSGHCFRPLGPL